MYSAPNGLRRSFYLSLVRDVDERSEIIDHFKKKKKLPPSRWGNGNLWADFNRNNLPHSLCSLCRHVLSLALIRFTVFTYLLGKIDSLICCSVRNISHLVPLYKSRAMSNLNSLNMGFIIWLLTAFWLATVKRNRFALKCQWGDWTCFLFSKSLCHQWTDRSAVISLLDLLSPWDGKVNGLLRESTSQSHSFTYPVSIYRLPTG